MAIPGPGELLRTARSMSGMSQRALAKRAKTAQSVVARVELGETSPSVDTLLRLLEAAGFELSARLERTPVVSEAMLDDVPRILRMTPEQRLREVAQISRFITHARRV